MIQSSWKELIKRIVYTISFMLISAMYVLTNHYTGRERELSTFIDNAIPFNKYFIFVYVFWYVYVAGFLVYFFMYDEKKYYKILVGLNAGMLICYLIYIIFPTTLPRHMLYPVEGITGHFFKLLYARDNPYNCFPSIHVLNTMIIAVYVQKDELYLNNYIKKASLISAASIIFSTLAIKQHVILDVAAAGFLAYMLYGVLEYRKIYAKVRSMMRVSQT